MISKIMNTLRRKGFFLLDQFQGGTVKEAYKKLCLLEKHDWDSPEAAAHKAKALDELIKHSMSSVKFYSKAAGQKLSEFPVINKEVIRSQQDDFISSDYDKTSLFKTRTSGSTGTPFTCYQNKGKKKHVNAELIFFSKKVGYEVGKKLVFFRAVPINFKKSKLKQWIQNESIIDITRLDDESVENALKKMGKSGDFVSMALGYSSAYSVFKDYFERKGTSVINGLNIGGFVAFADMLHDDTREAISKAFNCRCYSRYSNQENGIIGQDDTENNVFILNEAHYIVEIMKLDKDEPVEKKEEVGRIIITDLYNKAMPMIRYDTGDIGSIKVIKKDGVLKRAIYNFGGRRVDSVFDSKGNVVSPFFITKYFFNFPEVKQFQFIQKGTSDYIVKVNVKSEFKKKDEVIKFFKGKLGEDSQVRVEVVDEIPVLSSGKRKYIVNLME